MQPPRRTRTEGGRAARQLAKRSAERTLCRATHRSARTRGGALGGAARDTRLRRQPGTACNRVVLRPITEKWQLSEFRSAELEGSSAHGLPLFLPPSLPPQGTVGAPFQRATPTHRAPPGAVGTLPPPPGRPPVHGLLWAHYMPALFADSGPNKGTGVPGTECLLVGLGGYQSKSAVHGRTQQSGRVREQLGSTLSRRAPCLQQP